MSAYKPYKPKMPEHRLKSFVTTITFHFEKGDDFETAFTNAVSKFPDLTPNALARIRNATKKALKLK